MSHKYTTVHIVDPFPGQVPKCSRISYTSDKDLEFVLLHLLNASDYLVVYSKNLKNGKLVSILFNPKDTSGMRNTYIVDMIHENTVIQGRALIVGMLDGIQCPLDTSELSEYIASFTLDGQ